MSVPTPSRTPSPAAARTRSSGAASATRARGSAGLRRWLGRLLVGYVVLRTLLLVAICLAGLIVVTAIVGAWVESNTWRLLLGVAAVLVAPLLARAWLRARVKRRGGQLRLAVVWSLTTWNVALLALLCLGFSDAVGRSVRRRGDWFLGATDGWLPRRYRRGIVTAGLWMERFDVPPEARTLLAEAAVPQIAPRPRHMGASLRPLPPSGVNPLGPPVREPNHPGPTSRPVEPPHALWYYPLSTRVVPRHAACRFGAPRRGRFPPECELGHCGVDLEQPRGTPVRAVHDAVVQRLVRDEAAGGSGRTLLLLHKDGQLMTTYLHLHSIRADLRVGSKLAGGELIGTVGSTGNALGPHLHFGLSMRQGETFRFIDPEPLIRHWSLEPADAQPQHAARARSLEPEA